MIATFESPQGHLAFHRYVTTCGKDAWTGITEEGLESPPA